jgi:hypothetical protein
MGACGALPPQGGAFARSFMQGGLESPSAHSAWAALFELSYCSSSSQGGFEPPTRALSGRCSTAELLRTYGLASAGRQCWSVAHHRRLMI